MVSIALHWAAAVAIIGLLATGNALSSAAPDEVDWYRSVHLGIAISAYLVLLFRIFWRVHVGHPGALRDQSNRMVTIAKFAHFLLLGIIGVMLVSGPAMAIIGGLPVSWFGVVEIMPSRSGNLDGYLALHHIHKTGAMLVFLLLVAHVGGALWHMIALRDRTMDKMLLPAIDIRNDAAANPDPSTEHKQDPA